MSHQRVAMPTRWVDHFLSNVDHGFSSSTDMFDSQRASHEDTKITEIEALFNTAIREYQQMLEVNQHSKTTEVAKCESWEDLAALVDKTESDYIHDAGPARRLTRAIGDYSSALQAWTGLLPTDHNLSILGGGVKLLLRAAGKRSAQRERMLAALRTFFETVADSENSLRQFGGDRELRSIAKSLYVAILRMIEACINSLVHESIWTKVKYGLFGTRPYSVRKLSQEKVDHVCLQCDDTQREFGKRVEALTRIKIVETASATNRVETHIVEKMEPIADRTETVANKTYLTAKEIQERGRRMDLQMRRVSDTVDTQGDILLNIREMLRDLLSNNEWQQEALERRSQQTRLQVENYQLGLERVRSLTPSESPPDAAKKWILWKIIDVDPKYCLEEAGSLPQTSHGLSKAPGQVLKMYKHSRVKAFLTSAASDAIFVEAPTEGEETSRCSSMTLACSLLLQDALNHSHAKAIHYFCGAHMDSQDPVSSGIGIARILIGQLLCLQDFDFSFLDEEWTAALDQGNQDALFALFEPLIAQLITQTLFCVIDGVALFEGNKRKDETVAVISELLRVVANCQHTVHLKFLVTSSSRSRIIGPIFQHGESGHSGLVKLRFDDGNGDVTMRAIKLEIARHGSRYSVSPGRPTLPSNSSFP